MNKFSNEDLKRWKKEINAGVVISTRVPSLRKINTEWEGLCPFHEERTPSFKVYKQDDGVWTYKCFGCGANGNVFQFVERTMNLKFPEAVAEVLRIAGVSGWENGAPSPEPEPTADAPEKPKVTFTIAQYNPSIKALEESQAAQEWLAARGIGMTVAREFKLGFVQSAEKLIDVHPWLKDGWVLFPTLTPDGQTVTAVKWRSLTGKKEMISGRAVSGILRARDTSTTLYNIQAINPEEDVWVVEGEPDTLVLAQIGCGTVGFPSAQYVPTDDECEILSKCPRRFLAGDGDKSGKKAMQDFQQRLRGATYVIEWPNKRKDANDTLTNECGNDVEKFRALVDELKRAAIQTEDEALFISADNIETKRIDWMWEGKIPLGKMSMFAGNPDNGKSLASVSVAAIATRGGPWPGNSKSNVGPSDVLMLIGEDDLDDTVVPRLIASGADLKRIQFLPAMLPVKGEEREVRLDVDIPAIERRLETNPNLRLIIIDPISNYLGEKSMVAEQEVRSILIPLRRMAEKFSIAILIIMHLNKKSDLDAISRVGGAMAFIGVCRSSWLFQRDKRDEVDEETAAAEPTGPETFSMLKIKNNLAPSTKAGVSYTIAATPVKCSDGSTVSAPFVVWGGQLDRSADDALQQPRRSPEGSRGRPAGIAPKASAAVEWLKSMLADGERPSKEIMELGKAEGRSDDTIRVAAEKLNVVKRQGRGKWFWRLPDELDEAVSDQAAPGDEPRQSLLIDVGEK